MDKKTEAFISFVKEECKKNSVKFKPYKRSYIKLTDDIKCGGFFDDGSDPKLRKATLAFAQGRKDFLELMVHEYCHMTQWIDGIELWDVSADSLTVVDEWLSGVDHPDELVEVSLNNSRELELDNEKRSAKLIEKYDLSIDKEKYIKKANAYLYFHHWMRKTRRWSSSANPPYRNKNIIAAMPSNFRGKYDKLPKRFEKLFEQENI